MSGPDSQPMHSHAHTPLSLLPLTAALPARPAPRSSLESPPVPHTLPGVDYVSEAAAARARGLRCLRLLHCIAGDVRSKQTLSISALGPPPQVPDTPEEDPLLAAPAPGEPQASSEALRRLALRRSAEKAGGAAVTAPSAAAGAGQMPPAAGLPDERVGRAAAAAAGALTRDLTNQLAPPHQQQPQQQRQQQQQQGAVPPPTAAALPQMLPRSPQQLPTAGPVPLAHQQQWQRQQQPASFLAGAKAALQEASAAGAPPAQQPERQWQTHLELPLAAVAQARAANGSVLPASTRQQQQQPPQQQHPPARPGQAPQLALHRSPLALGPPVLPGDTAGAGTAPAAAGRTPQAMQLGLQRTPEAEPAVPPTGRTDGGASAVSGEVCGLQLLVDSYVLLQSVVCSA